MDTFTDTQAHGPRHGLRHTHAGTYIPIQADVSHACTCDMVLILHYNQSIQSQHILDLSKYDDLMCAEDVSGINVNSYMLPMA